MSKLSVIQRLLRTSSGRFGKSKEFVATAFELIRSEKLFDQLQLEMKYLSDKEKEEITTISLPELEAKLNESLENHKDKVKGHYSA
jgi:hypothetical protein